MFNPHIQSGNHDTNFCSALKELRYYATEVTITNDAKMIFLILYALCDTAYR